MATVDELFEGVNSKGPVFLKADVQGYELEVLRGAGKCLEATEVLLLEVSFRRIYKDCALAHEIISFLGARRFRIYDVCSYMQRAVDRELIQGDMVFARESSQLFRYESWNLP